MSEYVPLLEKYLYVIHSVRSSSTAIPGLLTFWETLPSRDVRGLSSGHDSDIEHRLTTTPKHRASQYVSRTAIAKRLKIHELETLVRDKSHSSAQYPHARELRASTRAMRRYWIVPVVCAT